MPTNCHFGQILKSKWTLQKIYIHISKNQVMLILYQRLCIYLKHYKLS